MEYERPYYEDIDYHPMIFYVIFGVNGEQLNVSRRIHHVDEFPEGLDLSFFKKDKSSKYMRDLIGGTLGRMLGEQNPIMYEAIKHSDNWAVIRGEVKEDSNLNYMRNVIGFVQALVEKDAIGVLDLQTFTLFTSEEWTDKIFKQEFNPNIHVTILVSQIEDGTIWIHTRGMRKFGRPDISIKKVPKSEIDNAVQIINQMIFYGALGAFFNKIIKLHTQNRLTCIIRPEFIDDLENPDFNNSYYYILWDKCEILTEEK